MDSCSSRAEKAFRRYSILAGFGKGACEVDKRFYDMAERLKLADMVAADGHKVAADLGSQYGGMTYVLKECGVDRVVATERSKSCCKRYLKRVNDEVIRCDSFRLPLRNIDALVSYMFLGGYAFSRIWKNGISKVFGELSKSAGTIYSVELESEYRNWFMEEPDTPSEIKAKLEEALPDFEVECLGEFGKYKEVHLVRGKFMDGDVAMEEHIEERLGFRFTKKPGGIQ